MSAIRLVALGDSHLEAAKYAAELGLLGVESYVFSIVGGATAVGLRNPNALTNAVNIFKEALSSQPRDACVLIHLGEVDCGFVIWWRAQTHKETVERQFVESIEAYRVFLGDIIGMGFNDVCIVGSSLPTIRNGVDFGEVANKRSEIKVSIEARTELTVSYNHELKKMADEFGISYFDITDAVLDRSTNLVHDFYRNSDPCNHHLDMNKTVGIWAAKLNEFFLTRE